MINKHRGRAGAIVLTVAACSACSVETGQSTAVEQTPQALRSLSSAEVLEDFDQIVLSYRRLYGALERKQARYGFDFDQLASEYRSRAAQATSEADYTGIFTEFNARFKDPHISLRVALTADAYHAFELPFTVVPIEDTYVVNQVVPGTADKPAPVSRGEELVRIDETQAGELAERFLKYVGIANPLTAKAYAANYLTLREGAMAEGLQPGSAATLELRNAAGEVREVVVPWTEVPNDLYAPAAVPAADSTAPRSALALCPYETQLTQSETGASTAAQPFFLTAAVREKFAISDIVRPSVRALEKYGVDPSAATAITYYAATYTYGGAKILLLRLPDYQPANPLMALSYLRALLDEQSSSVDALVFDQTHNGGGQIAFAEGVVTLLAAHEINGIVQEWNADRLAVQEYARYGQALQQAGSASDAADYALVEQYAQAIDAAYSAGQPLSPPVPFSNLHVTEQADPAHWTKPLLVLADERSGSAADLVPLLLQANRLAPVFGQRTAGAGGSVEAVATLPNTGLTLSLSRGLATVFDPTGAYPDERFIEDNGVTPDIVYSHTLADFRAGYIGYVDAFSRALLAQCDHQDTKAL